MLLCSTYLKIQWFQFFKIKVEIYSATLCSAVFILCSSDPLAILNSQLLATSPSLLSVQLTAQSSANKTLLVHSVFAVVLADQATDDDVVVVAVAAATGEPVGDRPEEAVAIARYIQDLRRGLSHPELRAACSGARRAGSETGNGWGASRAEIVSRSRS